VLDQSLSISEFDGLGEEAVTQSGREGQNATVPMVYVRGVWCHPSTMLVALLMQCFM